MKTNYLYTVFALILLVSFTSCKTHERLVYFQEDISSADSSNVNTSTYTPVLKVDDFISIVITADDPESTIPFNLPVTGMPGFANSGYTMGTADRIGYLIDNNGNINMPIIGQLELKGLSRMEATALIEDSLKKYVTHPIVNIQILNYKVTVLGDVQRPGTFKVPNERITLLEAIGLAGDLNITGNRKNILVIRENNGEKEEIRIDLTSSDIFSSPAYYLEQNDVVYIEPNKTARSNSTIWKTSGGIFISLTALVLTTVSILTK